MDVAHMADICHDSTCPKHGQKMFGNQRKCGHRVILEFNHITGPTRIILNNFNHDCS